MIFEAELTVTPAKAGVQLRQQNMWLSWILAFAGMTGVEFAFQKWTFERESP
jgi:hypothetical protein